MKIIPRLALVGMLLNVTFPSVAMADDWGCEVLLCLANPGGPDRIMECRPPIKRLWRHLAKGKPFPTCFMGGGKDASGNGAEHRFASASYCPDNHLIPPQHEHDEWHCALSGAVTVYIGGQATQRVWWSGEQSYSEPLGGSADSASLGNSLK